MSERRILTHYIDSRYLLIHEVAPGFGALNGTDDIAKVDCATCLDITNSPAPHDCEACEDCLHNGNKCCGCYDGACCREVVSPPAQPDGEASA